MFGYIMGVFPGYTDSALWGRTPQQLRVLYQQAARERRRRQAEAARAVLIANDKNPNRHIQKLEDR